MADLENEGTDEMEEVVVVMTDDEGNEFYYREEMIVPVGDNRYAILAPIDLDADCDCEDEHCDCCGDTEVFIARIDQDESGEEVYVDPTDEEFDQVRAAYEALLEEADGE